MKIKLKFNKKLLVVSILVVIALTFVTVAFTAKTPDVMAQARFWDFQSVDTMKYSRDLSREKLNDSTFDVVIERQIKLIADTGATHVGIATPYDEEFLPILKRWVKFSRQYNLKVWFRGNFSGWEGWFGYDRISREEHIRLTEKFILNNSGLFEDGDVFSACPECENGGPGDPRHINDKKGHQQFLIEEYEVTKKSFKKIRKDVASNYHSMNGDVANLIMDKDTTKKLDGIIVVDHYVKTPEQLSLDIDSYAQRGGGKVILGEFGAPIPDIHGEMSEIEQAEWLSKAMQLLSQNKNLVGVNYWVNIGGSTELWLANGTKKAAAEVLKKAYSPSSFSGSVKNVFGKPIKNAVVVAPGNTTYTNNDGTFLLPSFSPEISVKITADGYVTRTVNIASGSVQKIILERARPNFIERFLKLFSMLPSPFIS